MQNMRELIISKVMDGGKTFRMIVVQVFPDNPATSDTQNLKILAFPIITKEFHDFSDFRNILACMWSFQEWVEILTNRISVSSDSHTCQS